MLRSKGDYNKYKVTISHSTWKHLKTEYPEYVNSGLDYWTVRRILSDFSDILIQEVVDNHFGFKLPYNLGCLRMVGVKVKKISERYKYKKIDYARTDNVIYSMMWIKGNIKSFNFFHHKTPKLIQKKITNEIRKDKFINWTIVSNFSELYKIRCK